MSKIYISRRANPAIIEYLCDENHQICFVESTTAVYEAVCSHPDIYMCKLGALPKAPIFHGEPSKLGHDYPGNIAYNAVCMGKYFIHSLTCTDPELLKKVEEFDDITKINVKQGYTKCNMVVLNDNAAITSDQGIAKALQGCDIDLLLISKGHVKLSGFPYGFLGGASGRVGDKLIFNGNLAKHPDYDKIRCFIEKHHLKLKFFENYELEDIGSIIEAPEQM